MCCDADTYGWDNDISKVEKEVIPFKKMCHAPLCTVYDLPARVYVVGGPGHLVCQLGH